MSDSWTIYAQIMQRETERRQKERDKRREYKLAMKKLKRLERNREPRIDVLLCALGRKLVALGHGLMQEHGCRDGRRSFCDSEMPSGACRSTGV